jgi:hypothetical protein
MSTLTPELNLIRAQDDDDNADYLVTDLANSLGIVDGLFNATTGHTHNGAHQGGALQFQDLTIGDDLVVNATSTLKGAVYAQAGLTVTGALSSSGLATLNALDVTTTSRLRGAATTDAALTIGTNLTVNGTSLHTGAGTFSSTLTVTGGLAANGGLTVTGNTSISGLLGAGRLNVAGIDYGAGFGISTSTGIAQTFWYQRGSGSTRCWDNADFTFATTSTASTLVQRDGSGMLADPKVAGQVTLGGASYTFPTVTGNAGLWRYVKAWSQNLTILLTNGTFILDRTQYTSGQYTLQNGDSVSCYCDGSNWWVL